MPRPPAGLKTDSHDPATADDPMLTLALWRTCGGPWAPAPGRYLALAALIAVARALTPLLWTAYRLSDLAPVP
jgi:hypothetical protein